MFLFCCQSSLMYADLCSLRRLTVDIYRKGSVVSVIRKICIYISVAVRGGGGVEEAVACITL